MKKWQLMQPAVNLAMALEGDGVRNGAFDPVSGRCLSHRQGLKQRQLSP